MKVISIVNIKGGTGKSTIAFNIATMLADEGAKVMIVDVDKNQEACLAFAKLRSKVENKDNNICHISAISIPDTTLYKDISSYQDFDYLIIDAGAGNDRLVRTAISCSTYGMLLIPLQPSLQDLWMTDATVRLLEEAKSMGIPLEKNYLVISRKPTNERINILAQVKNKIVKIATEHNIKIMKTEIGNRMAYEESTTMGLNVKEYKRYKPQAAKAADEMSTLVEEIKLICNMGK